MKFLLSSDFDGICITGFVTMLRWTPHQLSKATPAAHAKQRPDEWTTAPLMAYLAERELLLPARLLGSGHQPLAFVMAHVCHLCAPVGALLGLTPAQGWSAWVNQLTDFAFGPQPGRRTVNDRAADETI